MVLLAPAAAQADTLGGAQFNGLAEIDVTSAGDLTGIAPANVTISKPGGATVPAHCTRGEGGRLAGAHRFR